MTLTLDLAANDSVSLVSHQLPTARFPYDTSSANGLACACMYTCEGVGNKVTL